MSRKKTNQIPDAGAPKKSGDRLLEFINDKNMLPAHLARAAGVHASTVASYLSNETAPKKEFLRRLSEKFDLNPAWVEYGVGTMYLQQAVCPPSVHELPAQDYQAECLRLQHELAAKDRELAAVELAKGRQQGRIFEAMVITCRQLGLAPDVTRILQLAVMDYEGVLADTGQSLR